MKLLAVIFCALLFTVTACENKPADSSSNQPSGDNKVTPAPSPPGSPVGSPPAQTAPEQAPAVDTKNAVTTPSGLKYIDLVAGTGEQPKNGQFVTVQYTGWLLDGRKFDSSLDRGRPFPFPLGQSYVIKGWDEGVSTMKVGGKRRLIVPPELGYAKTGRPPLIPPDSTLVFDIELVGIR
jgi:peptidylprolyl isomerase